jgi:hypothetical protein
MVTELQSSSTCFEVIDDQQRLTTLYLLQTFRGKRRYAATTPVPSALRVATQSDGDAAANFI